MFKFLFIVFKDVFIYSFSWNLYVECSLEEKVGIGIILEIILVILDNVDNISEVKNIQITFVNFEITFI